ncbi:ABC transporter permease [Alphaproteobacteria bacterium KMM 3653]|uniref:ABC transporter permease n=1 Tax=Harenicola maris TaxID=2841044 RepID=A0AAP2CX26_9RHOB|nr:ABC transporter permease [Harenicola maris]
MRNYLLKRLAQTIPVLFGISILVFSMLHLAPGDPADLLLGPDATPEAVEDLREDMGLNRPLIVQYGAWAGRIVQGDFGRSVVLNRAVLPEVMKRFKNTLILTAGALAFAVVFGIGIGILAAKFHQTVFDSAAMLVALAGISMPTFFTGIAAILIFAMGFQVLPSSGMYPARGGDFFDLMRHLLMPAVTLGAVSAAILARITRSAMLEVIQQDFIRTARAKGVSEDKVVWIHALRNASITIVTVLGMQIGYLLGGSVITEAVFSWPGLGQMMVRAIQARDYPTVQGGVLIIAMSFVFINLAVDLIYAWLDPRIRYS